jgi:hypothetical protein
MDAHAMSPYGLALLAYVPWQGDAFRDTRGPFCGWLHVDAPTLGRHAERTGWSGETIVETEAGEYLALLTPAAG